MKRLLLAIGVVVIALLGGVTAHADYAMYIPVAIQESGGNSYTNIAVQATINNTQLISNNYIAGTALDTDFVKGSTSTAYMPTGDRVFFHADSIGANSGNSYNYRLKNTPAQTTFKILTGYNGSMSTTDATNIEIGSRVLDNFTGNTSSDLVNHTADSGQAWATSDTHWLITGNHASYDGTTASQVAAVEGSSADTTFQASLTTPADGSKYFGLAFRYQDSTNFLLILINANDDLIFFQTMVAGVRTGISTAPVTISPSTTYVIKIRSLGSNIKIYVDDVLKLTETNTTFQTQTKYGLFNLSTGASDWLWDNLRIGPASWTITENFYLDATKTSGNVLRKANSWETVITAAGIVAGRFYPDATLTQNGNTADAYASQDDATWNTAWTAATADSVTNDGTIRTGVTSASPSFVIRRGFVFFDTSAIPSGASILSAYIQIYVQAKNEADGATNYVIQSGQPNRPSNPVVVGDYDKSFYTGSGGSVLSSSLTTSAYNTITLNSTGRGFITGAGTTKLAIRSQLEIDGTVPTGANNIDFDSASGSNPPVLIVVYSSGTPVSVAASAATDGTHAYAVSYDGTQITMNKDGVNGNSTATSAFPFNNEQAWITAASNSTPYIVTQQIAVNGTNVQVLQPTSISHITGTTPTYTITDMSVGGNNGVITAGSNPAGVTVTADSLQIFSPAVGSSVTEDSAGSVLIGTPTLLTGAELYATPGVDSSVPYLGTVQSVWSATALGAQRFFAMLAIGITVALAFFSMKKGFGVGFSGGIICIIICLLAFLGPLPGWLLFVAPVVEFAIVLAQGRMAGAT